MRKAAVPPGRQEFGGTLRGQCPLAKGNDRLVSGRVSCVGSLPKRVGAVALQVRLVPQCVVQSCTVKAL